MPYQADGNQGEIVDALRAVGCSVAIIGGANGQAGVPDLLVGRCVVLPGCTTDRCNGRNNFLLEVKTPKRKGRSQGQLSPKQAAWHLAWRGQVAVVRTVEEALAVVGLVR